MEDTIGVIINTPIHYSEWRNKEKTKYGWDNTYVIDFIREGYLDHMHIKEQGLELFTKDIPENLSFLEVLSEHYKGKIVIKNDIFKDNSDLSLIFKPSLNCLDCAGQSERAMSWSS